jgi:hypothetical protein
MSGISIPRLRLRRSLKGGSRKNHWSQFLFIDRNLVRTRVESHPIMHFSRTMTDIKSGDHRNHRAVQRNLPPSSPLPRCTHVDTPKQQCQQNSSTRRRPPSLVDVEGNEECCLWRFEGELYTQKRETPPFLPSADLQLLDMVRADSSLCSLQCV